MGRAPFIPLRRHVVLCTALRCRLPRRPVSHTESLRLSHSLLTVAWAAHSFTCACAGLSPVLSFYTSLFFPLGPAHLHLRPSFLSSLLLARCSPYRRLPCRRCCPITSVWNCRRSAAALKALPGEGARHAPSAQSSICCSTSTNAGHHPDPLLLFSVILFSALRGPQCKVQIR